MLELSEGACMPELGESIIGETMQASDPECSLQNSSAPARLECMLVSIISYTLDIRSLRVHVPPSLIATYQL
jgi:hypothetical protein